MVKPYHSIPGWRGSITKQYPLWQHSFFGWLVPALIAITLMVVVLLYGEAKDPVIAKVITVLACGGIFTICFAGLLIQLSARWDVLSSMVSAHDYGTRNVPIPIAFCIRPGISSQDEVDAYSFCLQVSDEAGFIIRLTNAYQTKRPKEYEGTWAQPIVFVNVKSRGKVKFWDGFAKVMRRVRGFQRGNWIEVEWLGEDTTRKLVLHELAHVICSASGLGTTTQQQHDIMKEVSSGQERKK